MEKGQHWKAFSSCSNVFSSSYISLIIWKINGLGKVTRSDCEQRKCKLTVQCEMLTYRNAPCSGLQGPFALSAALLQYSQQLWALPTVLASLCELLMKWLSQVLNSHSHLPFLTWTEGSLQLGSCIIHRVHCKVLVTAITRSHHWGTMTSSLDVSSISFCLETGATYSPLSYFLTIIMNLENLTLLGFSLKGEIKE